MPFSGVRTVSDRRGQMRTHHFGRKLELPSTTAIKHQLRKLMAEEASEKARAEAAETPALTATNEMPRTIK
jgi:hypothetical protein